ncbi:MAG: hypothetical protein J5846_00935 [Desulfovibrio sp.]|nr:hypothetical protein [Desulfovibrio sp.]
MSKSFLFWVLYTGLIIIPIAHFNNYLGFILWLVFLIIAYLLRKNARSNGDTCRIAHASWAINTYWIELFIPIAILIAALVVFAKYSDGTVEKQIENYLGEFKKGSIDFMGLVTQIWSIDVIRKVTYVILGGLVLIIWPVKRAVQGMIALVRNVEPTALSGGLRFLALILGFLLISCLSCLGTFLASKLL